MTVFLLFWTKWNSIWFKIGWKTVTTIMVRSNWKEMEIHYSGADLIVQEHKCFKWKKKVESWKFQESYLNMSKVKIRIISSCLHGGLHTLTLHTRRVGLVIGAPLSENLKKNNFQVDKIWGKLIGATAEAPKQSQSGGWWGWGSGWMWWGDLNANNSVSFSSDQGS